MKHTTMVRHVAAPHIHRRTFLRGVLGGVGVKVAVPVLDAMLNDHGTALAAGAELPRRFGVFYWGGGIVHSTWVPAKTGLAWDLPDSLQPFANLRDHVTLVTGTNHGEAEPGHIPARGIALSSSHDLTVCQGNCVGTYRGQAMPEPSVDVIVSEAWKGQAPHDLVTIGICRKGPYASNSSWKRGGTAYNRHEPSPQALFDRLFATGVPAPGASVMAVTTAYEKSMLDAVKADAESLKGKLGKTDQRRMEQHLEGLRSLEMKLQSRQRDAMVACAKPGRPTTATWGDGGSREEKEAKSQAMSQLLATALACDLTRVFSYEWSATQSEAVYWEVGVNQEHHQHNHDQPRGVGMQKITRFIMQNFAYLAEQLKAKPEGAGTVLDRTLILGTSEHATAGAHDWNDHPFVLIGKAGGGLKAGQHVRRPSNNQDAPKVLLTAVRAVGVNLPKLGQDAGKRATSDVIPELLA